MKKIVIRSYMVGMVQTNVYYLHREGESAAIIFDPADYGREIFEALQKQGLEVKAIFLTHGHFDHISGVKALKEACGAPVYASALERDLLLSRHRKAGNGYSRSLSDRRRECYRGRHDHARDLNSGTHRRRLLLLF